MVGNGTIFTGVVFSVYTYPRDKMGYEGKIVLNTFAWHYPGKKERPVPLDNFYFRVKFHESHVI